MFNSPILDAVIGLVFIYLLYSLLATSVKEAWATLTSDRGRMLRKGIITMFTDTPPYTFPEWRLIALIFNNSSHLPDDDKDSLTIRQRQWKIYKIERGQGIKNWTNTIIPWGRSLYNSFYRHPIIKNYSDGAFFKMPSYISPENFSKITVEVLKQMGIDIQQKQKNAWDEEQKKKVAGQKPGTVPPEVALPFPGTLTSDPIELINIALSKGDIDCETGMILTLHFNNANKDLTVFRILLESWYNDTMERVSGWYKRKVQFRLFVIGIMMSIVFNIDSLGILSNLSKNKAARDVLASNATVFVQNQKPGDYVESDQYSPTVAPTTTSSAPAAGTAGSNGKNLNDSSLINNLSVTNQILGLGWDEYGINDSDFISNVLIPTFDSTNSKFDKHTLKILKKDTSFRILNYQNDSILANTSLIVPLEARRQILLKSIDTIKYYSANPDKVNTPALDTAKLTGATDARPCLFEVRKAFAAGKRDEIETIYASHLFLLDKKLASIDKQIDQIKNNPRLTRLKYIAQHYYQQQSVDRLNSLKKAYVVYKVTGKYPLEITFCDLISCTLHGIGHPTRSLIGLFVSAMAISLGAPFWFDLLSKFVNLRGTGKKVEKVKAGSNKQ